MHFAPMQQARAVAGQHQPVKRCSDYKAADRALLEKGLECHALRTCLRERALPTLALQQQSTTSKQLGKQWATLLTETTVNNNYDVAFVQRSVRIAHNLVALDPRLLASNNSSLKCVLDTLQWLVYTELVPSSETGLHEEYACGLGKQLQKRQKATDFTRLSVIPRLGDILEYRESDERPLRPNKIKSKQIFLFLYCIMYGY